MSDLIDRQAAIDAINHICPVDTEYDCTLLDRVDVRCVLSDLPSAQPEQRWISCSERLPTKPGRYLVTQKFPYGMRVTIAYFDWNEFWDEAVAWMPLPEPYKENKDASI